MQYISLTKFLDKITNRLKLPHLFRFPDTAGGQDGSQPNPSTNQPRYVPTAKLPNAPATRQTHTWAKTLRVTPVPE